MRRAGGFTLIELMIVVAIIAVIAAIAIPNLLAARLQANETSSISTLRSLSSAQAQFQASARADVDIDGTGEFGVFRELSGASDVRNAADGSWSGTAGASKLSPPVLSGAFRTVSPVGEVTRSGYHFRLFLPGTAGDGVTESSTPNAFLAPVHTDLAETTWCAYAWPASHAASGRRTFFINQSGGITWTDDDAYTGGDAIDEGNAGAAFVRGGTVTRITGSVAVGTVGRENDNLWRQVN